MNLRMDIDRDYLVHVLSDLVRIDSTNPSLSPDGRGEQQAALYVAQALAGLGILPEMHDAAPGRPNVVGVLRGTGGGRSLLLNAHLDTVGVAGMADPFGAAQRGGRLYGRGSQDMKGSMAAMLAAAKALRDAGIRLRGDLLITGVADEEYASIGMEALVQRYTADAAIVTEPTDMQLCRAHRGFIWYRITSRGRAAHGSRYREGIDAIMRMGRFLAQLDGLEQALRARPAHPLVGTPSLHTSLIKGGSEISVYAAQCELMVERRTAPGETIAAATAELEALRHALADDPTVDLTIEPTFARDPFEVAADAAIVQALDAALTARSGTAHPHVGASFWTDAALLATAGIETVLLGPRGHGLHSAEEWVDIDSCVDLAHVLAATAVDYCGTAGE